MGARRFDARIRRGLKRLRWDVPLLGALLREKHVRFARRATDPGWSAVAGPAVAGGFNPFRREILVPSASPVALWSEAAGPSRDARDFNESDRLVRQVLLMLHDYLHVWAYSRLRHLLPKGATFLRRPVSADTLEEHAFCHLLSEAVATVGLDYWYLSEIVLGDVVGLGSEVRNLTVSFRLADTEEHAFHHERGSFDSRSRRFFESLARFYCTGELRGFGAGDLARSPKLSRWLRHELLYGEKQRDFTRQWLAFLLTGRRPPREGQARPVACSRPWQRAVIKELGRELQAFVREGRAEPVEPFVVEPRARRISEPDLRFVNLRDDAAFGRAAADPWIVREQFAWLAAHRASRFRFPESAPEAWAAFRTVVGSGSPLLLERFLAGEERLAGRGADEPEDVFLLG